VNATVLRYDVLPGQLGLGPEEDGQWIRLADFERVSQALASAEAELAVLRGRGTPSGHVVALEAELAGERRAHLNSLDELRPLVVACDAMPPECQRNFLSIGWANRVVDAVIERRAKKQWQANQRG